MFYDIMHEAATRVRGALVGLYDDGVIDQEQSLRASLAVAERVDRGPPEDRGALIPMTTRLRAYSARLEARGRSRERPVAIDLRW